MILSLYLYIQNLKALNSFVTNFLGKTRTTVLFVSQSFQAEAQSRREELARRGAKTQSFV